MTIYPKASWAQCGTLKELMGAVWRDTTDEEKNAIRACKNENDLELLFEWGLTLRQLFFPGCNPISRHLEELGVKSETYKVTLVAHCMYYDLSGKDWELERQLGEIKKLQDDVDEKTKERAE